MKILHIILSAFIFLILISNLFASELPKIKWDPYVNVSETPGRSSYFPHIAATEDAVHVTWWDNNSEDPVGSIYYKKSTDHGANWVNFKVISEKAGYYDAYIVNSGNYTLIFWTDQESGYKICRYCYFDNLNNSWSNPVEISSQLNNVTYISASGEDNIVIFVWMEKKTSSTAVLKGRISRNYGQSFDQSAIIKDDIQTTYPYGLCGLTVTVINGEIIIGYIDTMPFRLMEIHSNALELQWSEELPVYKLTGNQEIHRPHFTGSSNSSTVYATWWDWYGSYNEDQMFIRKVGDEGWSDFKVLSETTGSDSYGDICVFNDNVFIPWIWNSGSGPLKLLYRFSDDGGVSWSDIQQITDVPYRFNVPQCYYLGKHIYIVGYNSDPRAEIYFIHGKVSKSPTVTAGGPYAVDEGGTLILSAEGFDPDNDLLEYIWDLDGDGVFETSGQNVLFSAETLDGPYTCEVTVKVMDSEGLSVNAQTNVEILNVPPYSGTIQTPASPVEVNKPVNISLDFSDSGTNDTHIAFVEWGDGSSSYGQINEQDGSGTVCADHVYSYSGAYIITIDITDDDGGISETTSSEPVIVDNPPIVNIEDFYNVNEGATIEITANGSDPDGDPIEFYWDLDEDGIFEIIGQTAIFLAEGLDGPNATPIQVVVKVVDDKDMFSIDEAAINILNVVPIVTSFDVPFDPVAVDMTFYITANFIDAGIPDTHIAHIDWGDGNSTAGIVEESSGAGTVTADYAYTASGEYTVTVIVTDDDNGSSEPVTNTIIANIAPWIEAGGPYLVDEGSTVEVNAEGGDADGDPVTFQWDIDNDGIFEVEGPNAVFSAADLDGPSILEDVIAAKVIDSKNFYTIDRANIEVVNVAPTIKTIAATDYPVPVNTLITVDASFTDPCHLDTHTAEWNWGDETNSPGTVSEGDGNGTVSGNHSYTSAGVYAVSLTVTDDDDGMDEKSYQFVVVYDPNAGFVTGGGWIDSPAGAYTPNPDLTGKANFGFVSKYKKGKSTPEGNTQFNFKVADLKFSSTSYDWMVIAGPNAKYKGSGTINNEGDYGFMLTARDEDLTGNCGIDKFRIKIWEKLSEDIIYDNQIGNSDDVEATDAIEGGSIVIHSTALAKGLSDDNAILAAESLPEEYSLSKNYPNPFNPTTTIEYALPEPTHVRMEIFNIHGEKVISLVDSHQEAGFYTVEWDGRDEFGTSVSNGIYLCRFHAGVYNRTLRMLLLK